MHMHLSIEVITWHTEVIRITKPGILCVCVCLVYSRSSIVFIWLRKCVGLGVRITTDEGGRKKKKGSQRDERRLLVIILFFQLLEEIGLCEGFQIICDSLSICTFTH